MNANNYGSLEACKRLQDAGIVLETDNYHVIFYKKDGEKDHIVHTEFVEQSSVCRFRHPLFRKHVGLGTNLHHEGIADIVPAPSMAKVWRELPDEFDTYWLTLERDMEGNVAGYKWGENWYKNLCNTNPTDALIDLLIWVRSNPGKSYGEKPDRKGREWDYDHDLD